MSQAQQMDVGTQFWAGGVALLSPDKRSGPGQALCSSLPSLCLSEVFSRLGTRPWRDSFQLRFWELGSSQSHPVGSWQAQSCHWWASCTPQLWEHPCQEPSGPLALA